LDASAWTLSSTGGTRARRPSQTANRKYGLHWFLVPLLPKPQVGNRRWPRTLIPTLTTMKLSRRHAAFGSGKPATAPVTRCSPSRGDPAKRNIHHAAWQWRAKKPLLERYLEPVRSRCLGRSRCVDRQPYWPVVTDLRGHRWLDRQHPHSASA